jgi:carbonic anhydrase
MKVDLDFMNRFRSARRGRTSGVAWCRLFSGRQRPLGAAGLLAGMALLALACGDVDEEVGEAPPLKAPSRRAYGEDAGEDEQKKPKPQPDPDTTLCSAGKQQSPVDIRVPVPTDLQDLLFDYSAAPIQAKNTGSTIQIEHPPGSQLILDGVSYALKQYHFHGPSEHLINGLGRALELHLVHESLDGAVAVVGVFVNEGNAQADLDPLFSALPATSGASVALTAMIDPVHLVPAKRGFFRYAGSLTTSPCTEGVTWSVMEQPIQMSKGQIDAFLALFPASARETQLLFRREVLVDATPGAQ